MSIKVIGYFGHGNTGDEQYKSTFKYVFKNHNLEFIDCDKIKLHSFKADDTIVLGGGDILCDYFLDAIISVFKGTPCKIIAVSVGLPFTDILVNTSKLFIIDYIFLRTRQDTLLFSQFFHKSKIFYLPDISQFMTLEPSKKFSEPFKKTIAKIKNSGKKTIGVTLNRHICTTSNTGLVVDSFARFIDTLIPEYQIVLLPFNTNVNCNKENDIVLQSGVYERLDKNASVLNIDFQLAPHETFALYDFFVYTVPMRFHACLFSIYKSVPIFPVFTTRKIANLMHDISWEGYFALETNEIGIPNVHFGQNLINSFKKFTSANLHKDLVEVLKRTNKKNKDYNQVALKHLERILEEPKKTVRKKTVIEKLLERLNKFTNGCDFRKTTVQKETIVSICSYYLTRNLNSVYNHGLMTKMFDENYDYDREWRWIISDHTKKSRPLKSDPEGLFNIDFVNQADTSGAHRSGWQYVYKSLCTFHNENETILDMYLDRTFHWNAVSCKELGIIPFTRDWMGFIHHTFDTSFSDYNTAKLFTNQDFLDSLVFCKGLFVLSKYLQKQVAEALETLGSSVPVYSLTHPSEDCLVKFSIESYIRNREKKLVHVGGWLRNIFSFYQLQVPSHFKKCALKGKGMSNYYPDEQKLVVGDVVGDVEVKDDADADTEKKISRGASENNWYKHASEYICKLVDSVTVISHASNHDYDKLLSENVVFINLVDASAVNTVIECIIRSTPIIVNELPSVVEYLGEGYPLYFKQLSQVPELLQNERILRAHIYLKGLDKTKFTIGKFISDLTNV